MRGASGLHKEVPLNSFILVMKMGICTAPNGWASHNKSAPQEYQPKGRQTAERPWRHPFAGPRQAPPMQRFAHQESASKCKPELHRVTQRAFSIPGFGIHDFGAKIA
mmetsp:Transcript_17725/g.32256  ORF Transcript_17725/g.32256 Transcript_17725/m.32256 type:complete len:107 (-) Transcript_17725:4-324(-)